MTPISSHTVTTTHVEAQSNSAPATTTSTLAASIVEDRILRLEKMEKPEGSHKKLPSICDILAQAHVSQDEADLCIDMLRRWPLSGNICLIDFFGVDLYHQLCMVKKIVHNRTEDLDALSCKFFQHYFCLYVSLLLLASKDPAHLRSCNQPKFFRSPRESYADFTELSQELSLFKHSLAGGSSSTAASRLRAKAYAPAIKQLDAMMREIDILQKILAAPWARKLFLDLSLNAFAEGRLVEAESGARPAALRVYIEFMDDLGSTLVKRKKIGINFSGFAKMNALFEQMVDRQFPTTDLEAFSAHYASTAVEATRFSMLYTGHRDRAIDDPTYTHERYCREINIRQIAAHNQEDFIAYLNCSYMTTYVFLNWMQDIHDTIARKLLPAIEERYRLSSVFINRIVLNINSLVYSQFASSDVQQEPPVFAGFRSLARELFLKTFDREKHALENSLLELVQQIYVLAQNERFMLSAWLIPFWNFREVVAHSKQSCQELPMIQQMLLDYIRTAKEKGEIDDVQSKSAFQEILRVEALPFATMIMVFEDIDALFTGKQIWDVVHLLPDAFIALSELDGFEALFPPPPPPLEKPVAVALTPPPLPSLEEPIEATPVSTTAVSTTAIEPPPKLVVVKVAPSKKKKRAAPSKHDFLTATKRRVILRYLEDAGFIAERMKGSHLQLLHPDTRAHATVPLDVGDVGTRRAIYRQAFGDDKKRK